MNKEKMEGIVDLLATMGEGLEHMKLQMSELRLEESFDMFKDLLNAAVSVNDSIAINSLAVDTEFVETAEVFASAYENTADAFNRNNCNEVLELLETQLIPAFKNWEACIRKYILNGFTA